METPAWKLYWEKGWEQGTKIDDGLWGKFATCVCVCVCVCVCHITSLKQHCMAFWRLAFHEILKVHEKRYKTGRTYRQCSEYQEALF